MITAHIASIPSRLGSLKDVIGSLYPQVAAIYVMLNGHTEAPSIEDPLKKINYVFLDNTLGDCAKLWDIDKREGFVLLADDDLIYPHNYAQYMLAKYHQHPKSLITLHGKSYHYPATRSHGGYSERYHCLHTVTGDHKVQVGGTGVMLLNTADIKLDIGRCLRKNMLDLWVGLLAKEQGVPIWVVEHRIGWLKYTNPQETIWTSQTKEQGAYEAHVLNLFIK